MAFVHGGRLVAQALKRHGVTHLFTLCGGHIQAIYDGCLDEDIRVVDVRHEQTAGHAADGYARVTGQARRLRGHRRARRHRRRHRGRERAARRHPDDRASAAPARACSATWARSRTWTTSTLMRPITKWSVQVPETRSHRRVHRLRVPRRAGERAGPGVPRDAARPADEHATTTRDFPPTAPLAEPPRPAGDPRIDRARGRASEEARSARVSSSDRSSAGRRSATR